MGPPIHALAAAAAAAAEEQMLGQVGPPGSGLYGLLVAVEQCHAAGVAAMLLLLLLVG
jgi:hypothetical protein